MMGTSWRRLMLASLIAWPLLGCHDDRQAAAPPAPVEPTAESVAHFCNMAVLDHPGPKGQIFLAGQKTPVWFASVRDTIAFTMLPEEPKTIAAIYVNDMSKTKDWEHPAPGSWVDARAAWYVLGSDYAGGMGGREVVPFADEAAANSFAAAHGGRLARFADVPQSYILDADAEPEASHEHAPHDAESARGGG
jgi:copper chaperone NosL